MRFSLGFVVYIIIGVLVAAGIIGDEINYFSDLNSLEEIINMVLVVLLWPLSLLGVDVTVANTDSGGGSPQGSGGGSGGSGSAGGAGK